MNGHVDILEHSDSLRRFLALSAVAHGVLFTSIVVWTNINAHSHGVQWGTPTSLGGGSVGITAVKQLPLPPRSGMANPLANDTESRVPAPPKPEPKRVVREEPDAIPIRARTKKVAEQPKYGQQARSTTTAQGRPNQLYSTAGQALSSNMYGNASGTGGVGVGSGSAFGYRFGWYRDLLERRIAEKWRTDEVDSRIQTAPPVIVTFTIMRNGTVQGLRVLQGSGNYALDTSAKRAVMEAAPFQELPRDFERNDAQIEIWFQLKR